jgi:hypothetical protein
LENVHGSQPARWCVRLPRVCMYCTCVSRDWDGIQRQRMGTGSILNVRCRLLYAVELVSCGWWDGSADRITLPDACCHLPLPASTRTLASSCFLSGLPVRLKVTLFRELLSYYSYSYVVLVLIRWWCLPAWVDRHNRWLHAWRQIINNLSSLHQLRPRRLVSTVILTWGRDSSSLPQRCCAASFHWGSRACNVQLHSPTHRRCGRPSAELSAVTRSEVVGCWRPRVALHLRCVVYTLRTDYAIGAITTHVNACHCRWTTRDSLAGLRLLAHPKGQGPGRIRTRLKTWKRSNHVSPLESSSFLLFILFIKEKVYLTPLTIGVCLLYPSNYETV